jgi:hypothetical protein
VNPPGVGGAGERAAGLVEGDKVGVAEGVIEIGTEFDRVAARA